MAYVKKTFEGEYLDMYNIINGESNQTIGEVTPHIHVAGAIQSLEWKGKSRDSVCNTLDGVEKLCDKFYQFTTLIVDKNKICSGLLFDELSLLKAKIDLYNSAIDDYNTAYSRYQEALAAEQEATTDV